MYLNVVSGRRPRGCRHLKTLYSKFTNVSTSARIRRKLKQPITGHTASWLLTLLKVTADIRWILSHGQQCWSWERLAVVVQHSRCQYAHGLASVRGRWSDATSQRRYDRYNNIFIDNYNCSMVQLFVKGMTLMFNFDDIFVFLYCLTPRFYFVLCPSRSIQRSSGRFPPARGTRFQTGILLWLIKEQSEMTYQYVTHLYHTGS